MYLNPQIRDTQDTFKIHNGIHRDLHLKIERISTALLAAALGYPQTPEIRVSCMYPACIPHVFRMYLDYL
jgi:hypothetical protein